MSSRPPLGMSVVMRSPTGAEIAWSDDSPNPENRPTGISFRTERGSGFLDGGCTLPRDIRLERWDMNSLNEARFVGADGSTDYEGALMTAGRSFDTGGHSISPTFVGPIALAQDRTMTEVYADRLFSNWGDAPLNEQAGLLTGGIGYGDFQWSSASDGLLCALPTTALAAQTVAELWYVAPSGVTVGKVMYVGVDLSSPAGYEAATLFASSDDHRTVAETYVLNLDNTLRTATLTTARGYLMLRVYSNGNARTPAAGASRRYSKIAVYGNHGLATHANGTDPEALHLTDILIDVFNRYAPQIDTSEVQEDTTLIAHAVYEDMFPHDAALDLNKYAHAEMGVWENKRLQFEQVPLDDYDWEVRLGDGATTSLQGDDAKNLRNGIRVRFTEAGSGKVRTLSPDDYDELRDGSVENVANEWGRDKWGEPYVLTQPCDENMALAAGVLKLAQDNAPTEAGSITVTGHVRDRAGHWQPAKRMRAGERVIISDFTNPRPRRLASTDYNGDSYQQTLSVDNATTEAEDLLVFYGAELEAANLS